MPQRQVLVPTGKSSKAGLALKSLMKAHQLVTGSLLYIETWEYYGGAYISRKKWGVVNCSGGTTSGFFMRPTDRQDSEWEFIMFENIGGFKLFELHATSFKEDQ